jgi:hypothetical protein
METWCAGYPAFVCASGGSVRPSGLSATCAFDQSFDAGSMNPCCVLINRRIEVIVDAQDLERVSKHKWCVVTRHRDRPRPYCYAETMIEQKPTLLHRFIVNAPKGMMIDHADGNTLNNARTNLRVCTRAQNSANSKLNCKNKLGLKGVCRDGSGYKATINIGGRKTHIGRFPTPEEAHAAYVSAAIREFGEFARAA